MRQQAHCVLIVGEDPILRDLLREVLTQERVADRIEVADSLPTALQVVRQEPVDVLIVDGGLSGTAGLALIERTQGVDGHISAILITAADADEIREVASSYTVTFSLLGKPFSIDGLLQQVERSLALRDAIAHRASQRAGHPGAEWKPAWNWI